MDYILKWQSIIFFFSFIYLSKANVPNRCLSKLREDIIKAERVWKETKINEIKKKVRKYILYAVWVEILQFHFLKGKQYMCKIEV